MIAPAAAVGGASSPGPAAPADAAARGQGFERVLLAQLTDTLVDSAMPGGETSSAASTAYRDLLPDALTEALMSAGGIGLAAALEEGGA